MSKMSSKSIWSLSWESSDVDWCEANFQITTFVAEFWNTLSNVLFFVFPPLLIYLFRQYARRVKWGINVVWALLAIVGVGSVYFHATLSLVGQLLDEIAIIWVFMAALALWFPKKYMPAFMQQDRKHFQMWTMLFAVLTTGLACVWPAVNCMVLFVLGVPATTLLVLHMKSCQSPRVYNLGMRCFLMWGIALTSWLSDNLFCNVWKAISFPYMHCLWHIFIALASYQACVLFAYFDALHEVPEQMPVVKYWPRDWLGWVGIPYVVFKVGGHKPAEKTL